MINLEESAERNLLMNVHEDTEELKYDQSSIDQLENIDSKETISSSGDLSSDDEK